MSDSSDREPFIEPQDRPQPSLTPNTPIRDLTVAQLRDLLVNQSQRSIAPHTLISDLTVAQLSDLLADKWWEEKRRKDKEKEKEGSKTEPQELPQRRALPNTRQVGFDPWWVEKQLRDKDKNAETSKGGPGELPPELQTILERIPDLIAYLQDQRQQDRRPQQDEQHNVLRQQQRQIELQQQKLDELTQEIERLKNR